MGAFDDLEGFEKLIAQPADEADSYAEHGFLRQTFEEAVEIAAAKGCVVRVPGPRELFIDIDSEAAHDSFERLRKAFPPGLIASEVRTRSPSGNPWHFHIVATLSRDLQDDRERVMLQAFLGSDPMRELLSWRRIENGSDSAAVSLFFEKAPT